MYVCTIFIYFFHQRRELKFTKEMSETLHVEYSYAWCLNLETSENRSGAPWNFWNVVLEKDEGEFDHVKNEILHRV